MLKIRYRRRNYCTAAPDWLPLIGNMGKVCRRHDRQYAIGGTKTLRKAVDIKFRMELRLLATRRRLPPRGSPGCERHGGTSSPKCTTAPSEPSAADFGDKSSQKS